MLNCAFKRVPLWCVRILKKNPEVKNVNIDFFLLFAFIIYLFILSRIKIGKLAIP